MANSGHALLWLLLIGVVLQYKRLCIPSDASENGRTCIRCMYHEACWNKVDGLCFDCKKLPELSLMETQTKPFWKNLCHDCFLKHFGEAGAGGTAPVRIQKTDYTGSKILCHTPQCSFPAKWGKTPDFPLEHCESHATLDDTYTWGDTSCLQPRCTLKNIHKCLQKRNYCYLHFDRVRYWSRYSAKGSKPIRLTR